MPEPLTDERLAEIEGRADRLCCCGDPECTAEFRQVADEDLPELFAEINRLRGQHDLLQLARGRHLAALDRLCDHQFPSPLGDPDADGYGPGDCTRCGMTYAEHDARFGERMAQALEGGA